LDSARPLTLTPLLRDIKIIAGVFFFQAEDGIRDGHVTGVQTCALPISDCLPLPQPLPRGGQMLSMVNHASPHVLSQKLHSFHTRSEERRVGKECRSRWSRYH